MFNFYQSKVWECVNRDIYKKPTFEVYFLWKRYFWTEKVSSKLWMSFRWYQVLWIELWDNRKNNIWEINNDIDKIKRDFNKWFGDMFFQLWIVDNIDKFDIIKLSDWDFVNDVKNKRLENDEYIRSYLWLKTSFRENMPLATLYFDLNKTEQQIWEEMSKSGRAHIKKWKTRWLEFWLADYHDWDFFYDIWHQTSYDKWFNIIEKETFFQLRDFIIDNNCWNLFLVKKDWVIVSGSICFFIDNNIVYLYWATNRDLWNIWWHHFLKYEMFRWWMKNWFKWADLLWISPTWFDWHHLDWVTTFKQSLWWTKIEYLWNYDIVFNNKLYEAFRLMRKFK